MVADDRFIMKQIKTVEISSFEQIAPIYFDHITSALENKVRKIAFAHILLKSEAHASNLRTALLPMYQNSIYMYVAA